MNLREDQIERYARHILLPDIGGRGQRKLLAKAVRATIGPGRPQTVCALTYLAAAGVGRLELDGDVDGAVSAAEVKTGIAYAASDIGRPRIDALTERLSAINPDVTVTRATAGEALSLGGDSAADVASALIAGGLAAARAIAQLVKS